MNIAFLDFDGVLNNIKMKRQSSRGCSRRIQGRPPNYDEIEPCGCEQIVQHFDRANVEQLNELVEKTQAKIVLSTSWRKIYDVPSLGHVLEEVGFKGEVVDETPDLPNDEQWKDSTRGRFWIDRIQRGHEIGEWLLRHPEVTNCVILDDAIDMWQLTFCHVQTNDMVGLTAADVGCAVDLLASSARPLAAFRARFGIHRIHR